MNNQVKYLVRKVVLSYYAFRYSSYYAIVIPLAGISAGILVFILFVLPQLLNWFSIRSEVEATQKRIDIMRINSRNFQAMSKLKIDNDFILAKGALPGDKDFVSILNAINGAALVSNVSLQDYEFSIGNIPVNTGKKVKYALPPVRVDVIVEGTVTNANRFLYEVERKLPISEIQSVYYSDNRGMVSMLFNMKPFPDLQVKYSEPLSILTQKDNNLLNILRQWSGE